MKRKLRLLLVWLVGCVLTLSAQSVRSTEVLRIDGLNYYIHRVGAGEGVADIASLYSLSDREIVAENNLNPVAPAIEEGGVLRIPCYDRVSRLQPKRGDERYDRYRTESGESLFKVAVDFAIALDTLVEDNAGLDIANLPSRTNLNIRRSAAGRTQLDAIREQSRRYASLLNSLSREWSYVVVEQGNTLYSLATANGVDVDDLAKYNGNPELIYEGMVLKTPRTKSEVPMATVDDTVREGIVEYLDSLAVRDVEFRPFEKDVLTVSLMLPLSDTLGRVRGSFVEFYQGALLAAEDMKNEGRSVDIQLFNTRNSKAYVDVLVEHEAMLEKTDLFVGPIYERNAESVVEFAAERGVPVVSPLATTTEGSYGRHYYRLAPTHASRTRKLEGMIAPETNVIMVYTASNDEDMEREMLSLLGDHPYGKVIYNEYFEIDSLQSRPIEELMAEDDNLFVVLSDNEIDTDRSLAIISSIMNSRQPKYAGRRVPVRVIGNAAWAKYKNMDKNLLFKLDVSYIVNYHADRSNKTIREFDRRFIRNFGRMPSMFAYRAYDAVRLFASAIFAGGDLAAELNGSVVPLLQTPYSFTEEGGNMVNDSWVLVNYRPNYTIDIK